MTAGLLRDGLLVPAVRAFCAPFEVRGLEHLRGCEGPFLVVANHASHLDAPAVLAALPWAVRRHTRVAAAQDYFFARRPLLGALVSVGLGAFPFAREGHRGLERAAALLRTGHSVLLFPEGTRSRDGRGQPFRLGAARLLLETGVPVLPVGLGSTHALWPPDARWPRRGGLRVQVGEPWSPPPGLDPVALTSEIERLVRSLADTASGEPARQTPAPGSGRSAPSTARPGASVPIPS